ncbi:hypothetical protein AB0H71_10515 [Nocardia sp. NPDC050697]|uniref:hypothetical protein n=1 Tax=Nocardia sp. NPDC050697 TaxID=3155158 RepID=UPI0033F50B5B
MRPNGRRFIYFSVSQPLSLNVLLRTAAQMVVDDRHRYGCDQEPIQLTQHAAELILRLHDHGVSRTCARQLAALAFLSNPQASEYE